MCDGFRGKHVNKMGLKPDEHIINKILTTCIGNPQPK
jgi:hypothetical protein